VSAAIVSMKREPRRSTFGMAIGPGQITLRNQARAVLHQRMADEAQHRPGAGRRPAEPGIRVGRGGMGAFDRFSSRKSASALRF
jgi:hypothetical protein